MKPSGPGLTFFGSFKITFSLFKKIFFAFLLFLGPLPAAYGSSQAGGLIEAEAADLCQSHSNMGPQPRLRATPQLTATPDP